MNELSQLNEFLPFLIPIVVLQLILIGAALFDLVRRDNTRGPKWAWLLAIVFIQFIGPIGYFVLGREE